MSDAHRTRVLHSSALGEARHWLAAERSNDAEATPSFEARVAAAEQAGFEKGYAEGLAQGSAEIREQNDRLAKLIAELCDPLDAVDEAVESELLDLATAIARQILKRELREDPAHLVGFVREAIARLPAGQRDIRVLLHPQDAAVVQHAMESEHGKAKESPTDTTIDSGPSDDAPAPARRNRWRLVVDPTLARGSCLVETEQSVVDGSVDALVDQLRVRLQHERRTEKDSEAG